MWFADHNAQEVNSSKAASEVIKVANWHIPLYQHGQLKHHIDRTEYEVTSKILVSNGNCYDI